MSKAIKKGDVISEYTVTDVDVLAGGRRVFRWARAKDSGGKTAILQILSSEKCDAGQVEKVKEYFNDLLKNASCGRGLLVPTRIFDAPGHPFVAVYADTDLNPLRETLRRLAVQDTMCYWEQAVESLHALHRWDLVHGAVSLDHFAVDSKNALFLREFGYAPLLERGLKEAVDECGPSLAPEARGPNLRNLTKEADIYGFAKTLAAWEPRVEREAWYQKATHSNPSQRFNKIGEMLPEIARTLLTGFPSERGLTEVFILTAECLPREGGDVNGVALRGEYPESTEGNEVKPQDALIEAVPKPGWRFEVWSGALSGTKPRMRLTMDENKEVTAHFTKVPDVRLLRLSGEVEPRRSGRVEGLDRYPEGSTVRVEAIPKTGWRFERWSGALSGTENPAELTLNEDLTVVAHFVKEGGGPPRQWGKALLLAAGSPWTVLPLLAGITDLVVLWSLHIESRMALLAGVVLLLLSVGTFFTRLLLTDVTEE